MGPSDSGHDVLDGALVERLDAGLAQAVADAARALKEVMPESANYASDAAAVSLHANFSCMIDSLRYGSTGVSRRLPDAAAYWPRELAHHGAPEECVIRGYFVSGGHWWRNMILPDVFEIRRDGSKESAASGLLQRTCRVVFDYLREVGIQANGEYKARNRTTGKTQVARVSNNHADSCSFSDDRRRREPSPTVSVMDVLGEVGTLDQASILIDQTLSRFDSEREDHRELMLTTLQWFDSLCCSVTAARRLGVHRNTLLYRLRKVEQLLGHSLLKDRLKVELAMRLACRPE